jgi:type IV secretory pathway VirB6-like protein
MIKARLSHIIISACLLFALSGCIMPNWFDGCIEDEVNSSTGSTFMTFIVQANNPHWAATGVSSYAVDKITVKGSIDTFTKKNSAGCPQKVEIFATNPDWFNTGVEVVKGDELKIIIGKPNDAAERGATTLEAADKPLDPTTCEIADYDCGMKALSGYVSDQCLKAPLKEGSFSPSVANVGCTAQGKGCRADVTGNKVALASSGLPVWSRNNQHSCPDNLVTGCWAVNGNYLSMRISPTPIERTGAYDKNIDIMLGGGGLPGGFNSFNIANPPPTHAVKTAGTVYLRIADTGDGTPPSPYTFSDNIGGYTVYITKSPGTAVNGLPNANGLGGLEIVAAPSVQDRSDPMNPKPMPDPHDKVVLPLVKTDSGDVDHTMIGKYTGPGPQNKMIWFRVKDTKYDDNAGYYTVSVTMKRPNHSFSTDVMKLVDLVKGNMMQAAQSIFSSMTCSAVPPCPAGDAACVQPAPDQKSCVEYIKILRALMTLYIIFYAICYIFGLVQLDQMDLVIRCLKIGIIITLTSPNSWNFFHDYFFQAFIDGGVQVINAATGNPPDSMNPFDFMDPIANYILSGVFWKKWFSLLLWYPIGPVAMVLILIAFIVIFLTVCRAVIVYCMAYLAMAILIALAPIFIPFILFKVTKGLFDKWVQYIVKYTLEPALLLIGLSLLFRIMMVAFNNITGIIPCWKCAIPIAFDLSSFGLAWLSDIKDLFCIFGYLPWGMFPANIAAQMFNMISFLRNICFLLIITYVTWKYHDISDDICKAISGTIMAPSATSASNATTAAVTNYMKESAQGAVQAAGNDKGGGGGKKRGGGEGGGGDSKLPSPPPVKP